jgi:hypothetical protein
MKTADLKRHLTETFGHLADDQLMALTLYGETRGESRTGKIAVGSVILERVEHRKWDGETVKEVCLMPYQFSCFLPNDPNYPALRMIAGDWDEALKKSPVLLQCFEISRGLLDGTIPRDPIIVARHATQYKTIDCKAAWESDFKHVATVGHHDFYA